MAKAVIHLVDRHGSRRNHPKALANQTMRELFRVSRPAVFTSYFNYLRLLSVQIQVLVIVILWEFDSPRPHKIKHLAAQAASGFPAEPLRNFRSPRLSSIW